MTFFEDIEWNPEYVPSLKLGLHVLQVLFTFAIFVLEILVFKDDTATINGQNGWVFGLTFLSLPAWCYLIMSPRFQRTRKIAEPHAMLVVDVIWAILWLSAFASQAAYNTANSCGGQCNVSKAIVGLAFFVTLFWIGTTFVSIYTMKYYQNNGKLPGYDRLLLKNENIDPDKAAFSMAPHDEEAYAPVHMDDQDHDDSHHPYNPDSYGSVGSRPMFVSDLEDNSYRPHSTEPHDDPYSVNTGYGGVSGSGGPRIYAPPSAQDEYDDGRPAQFPAGNYDRGMH